MRHNVLGQNGIKHNYEIAALLQNESESRALDDVVGAFLLLLFFICFLIFCYNLFLFVCYCCSLGKERLKSNNCLFLLNLQSTNWTDISKKLHQCRSLAKQ